MQLKTPNSKYLQENLLSAMAFSLTGDFCCLATKKDIRLLVFKVKDLLNVDSWELLQEMHDQTQPISEIDWSKDDKIISGSHDRSVFIYKRTGNSSWQKMLVNIDIKLSILCTKWAPSSKKFALSSSCRSFAFGFYNVESECWTVSSREKYCKAPIISISFHPSSNIIAAGASDNSVKVVTCSFKKSKETFVQKSDIQDSSYHGPFESIDSLFEVIYSIEDVGGWVNHISFELNGNFLLIIPHSNHLKVMEVNEKDGKIASKETDIVWKGLPFLNGFISDKGVLYAGGFDKKVAVFERGGNGFNFTKYLEANEKSSQQKSKKGIVSSMLSGIEKRGVIFGTGPDVSEHLNSIKVLMSPSKRQVVSYDSNGVIHIWN